MKPQKWVKDQILNHLTFRREKKHKTTTQKTCYQNSSVQKGFILEGLNQAPNLYLQATQSQICKYLTCYPLYNNTRRRFLVKLKHLYNLSRFLRYLSRKQFSPLTPSLALKGLNLQNFNSELHEFSASCSKSSFASAMKFSTIAINKGVPNHDYLLYFSFKGAGSKTDNSTTK